MLLVTLKGSWIKADPGGLLLTDLTEVFDMINYDLLTYHLANVVGHGVALQWITSFHRQEQRVVLGKGVSTRNVGLLRGQSSP